MAKKKRVDPTELDRTDADLCGLPQRSETINRDRLEGIASDFLDRLRAGESTDIEFFVITNPELEAEIRDFLPLVAAMEDWKSNQELQVVKQPLPEEFHIDRLGDCRVIREIARGGMGVVFEAEQEPIGRKVAVKLLPWKFSKTSKWSQQFHREARIVGQLQHPHIVPVFSFGEHEGRFYYIMQLIEGVGLDRLIDFWSESDNNVVPIDDLVREVHPNVAPRGQSSQRLLRKGNWQQIGKIAAQIMGAIRYAHQKHTFHRDIKPGNLLIDISGKVWITDFGLALARDHALSGERDQLAGTMRYMAPEQFRGEGDERSDLFSFGATLFELCTLQPAFRARTKRDLLIEVQKKDVTRPKKIVPDIPDALEQIILKALEKDPNNRYQTAQQLHADLLKFISGLGNETSNSVWKKMRGWFE